MGALIVLNRTRAPTAGQLTAALREAVPFARLASG